MNPSYSLPIATAPYYREARVTFAWRQTACGMRHCFARRIVECSVRRKLGCTATRLAERLRIVEAEANRIAALNAALPRAGKCNRQAPHLFELLTCNVNFLWEGAREGYLFSKKRYPSLIRSPASRETTRFPRRGKLLFFPDQNKRRALVILTRRVIADDLTQLLVGEVTLSPLPRMSRVKSFASTIIARTPVFS